MVKLIFMRYGDLRESEADTLEQAISTATWMCDSGEAAIIEVRDELGNVVLDEAALWDRVSEFWKSYG